jgi:hypothetical protein
MEDANEFPALSSLRPQRKFVGVQVPTMDPNFHGWAESATRNALVAVEVLGEQKTDNGDYVFVFYEDNVVRRVSPNLSSLLSFPEEKKIHQPRFASLTLDRLLLAASSAPIELSGTRIVSLFSTWLAVGCLTSDGPFQSTENSKEHCPRLTPLVVRPTYIQIREGGIKSRHLLVLSHLPMTKTSRATVMRMRKVPLKNPPKRIQTGMKRMKWVSFHVVQSLGRLLTFSRQKRVLGGVRGPESPCEFLVPRNALLLWGHAL